ncbi:MAG: membrane protein [Sulfuricurvum sp. PC08-66]|nr:MAG: membrane protein [Sulfuricurvum sp. PC08-66]
MFEKLFERGLWSSRFFVLLPVIFALVGALILFTVASIDVFQIAVKTIDVYINHEHPSHFHEEVVSAIIGAIDLYLIAIVMLIFSFGIYELFISQIDHADSEQSSKILDIQSLDDLKDKLAKVIVMVLVVSFFQKVLYTSYATPLEMLYFAGSILLLSVGLYFLHKGNH